MKTSLGSMIALLLLMSTGLGSCSSSGQPEEKQPPQPTLDPLHSGNPARKPGSYCFYMKEAALSISGRLELKAANEVEGYLKGHVFGANASADFEYDTSFNGRLDGDSLRLQVRSNATGSKQETRETWVWKSNGLQEGSHFLVAMDCTN